MRARARATYAQAGVCGREGRGIRACKAGVARLVMRPLDRQKEEPHWDIFSCLGGRLRQQQVIHPSVCGSPPAPPRTRATSILGQRGFLVQG